MKRREFLQAIPKAAAALVAVPYLPPPFRRPAKQAPPRLNPYLDPGYVKRLFKYTELAKFRLLTRLVDRTIAVSGTNRLYWVVHGSDTVEWLDIDVPDGEAIRQIVPCDCDTCVYVYSDSRVWQLRFYLEGHSPPNGGPK